MNPEAMTQEGIRREGLAVLARALGPAGLIRFLQQFDSGEGNYSSERHAWLDGLEVSEIAAEIGRNRPEAGEPG